LLALAGVGQGMRVLDVVSADAQAWWVQQWAHAGGDRWSR
jgi:hypothetical protein